MNKEHNEPVKHHDPKSKPAELATKTPSRKTRLAGKLERDATAQKTSVKKSN